MNLTTLPRWFTFLFAAIVLIFGLYRLHLARTTPPDIQVARRGLYGKPRRSHLLFGLLYVVLAALLIASAFGVTVTPFR